MQSRKRRLEDSQSQPVGQRISGESTVSSMSPAAQGENHIKTDAKDGTKPPVSSHTGSNGGIKRSILRQGQVDAWPDMSAGLPAEKGFPIQIGSELFRLSGASIMSDGQSLSLGPL